MRLIDADAMLARLEEWNTNDSMDKALYNFALCRINEQPTIEPERKKGRWIPVTNGRGGHECDQCHEYAPSWATGEEHLTKYCPNCGVRCKEIVSFFILKDGKEDG